jgi:hypothetical protein
MCCFDENGWNTEKQRMENDMATEDINEEALDLMDLLENALDRLDIDDYMWFLDSLYLILCSLDSEKYRCFLKVASSDPRDLHMVGIKRIKYVLGKDRAMDLVRENWVDGVGEKSVNQPNSIFKILDGNHRTEIMVGDTVVDPMSGRMEFSGKEGYAEYLDCRTAVFWTMWLERNLPKDAFNGEDSEKALARLKEIDAWIHAGC